MTEQPTTDPEILDLLAAHFALVEGLPRAYEWHPAAPGVMSCIDLVGTAGPLLASERVIPVLFGAVRRPDSDWDLVAVTRRKAFGRPYHILHRRTLDGRAVSYTSLPEGVDLTHSNLVRHGQSQCHRWMSWTPSLIPTRHRRSTAALPVAYFVCTHAGDVLADPVSSVGWRDAVWNSPPVFPYAPPIGQEVILERPDGALISLNTLRVYSNFDKVKVELLRKMQKVVQDEKSHTLINVH
jgi:hypothetical protein